MNYLIITFLNHKIYTYYKLVVDNFSSFTELGQLPNWYESSLDRNARRARCVELQEQDPRKNERNIREFGSLGLASQLEVTGPGLIQGRRQEIFGGK